MYLNGYDDQQLGFSLIPAALNIGRRILGGGGGGGAGQSISAADFIRQLEREGRIAELRDIADDAEGPSSNPGRRHRFNYAEQLLARDAVERLAPMSAPSVESALIGRLASGIAPPAAPAPTVAPSIAGMSPALLLGAVGLVGAFLLAPKLMKRRGYRGNPHRRRRRRSRARRR